MEKNTNHAESFNETPLIEAAFLAGFEPTIDSSEEAALYVEAVDYLCEIIAC